MSNSIKEISDLAIKFLELQDSEQIYSETIKEAVRIVGAETGAIILYEKGEPVSVYSTHPFRVQIRKRGFTYKAYKEGKIVFANQKELYTAHPEMNLSNTNSSIFVPLKHGKNTIGVVVITSQKNITMSKKDIPTLNLLSSLAALGIEKNLAYDEIRKTLDNRDLFISMAAHELRTPLTTIFGYAQLIHKQVHNEATSPLTKWSEDMVLETTRLKTLVDELLQVDNIKTRKLHYELQICNMRQILARVLKNFAFKYQSIKVDYCDLYKSEPELIADSDKMIQVILNILENAAKHNIEDKPVTLILKRDGNKITVIIRDEGEGIEKNEIPRLFEGFYKGSGSHKPGMGLGLYIARSIISHHRGKIMIESEKNKGTTVTISLPAYNNGRANKLRR